MTWLLYLAQWRCMDTTCSCIMLYISVFAYARSSFDGFQVVTGFSIQMLLVLHVKCK